MGRWLKYSIVPTVAAFAALFSVMPHTGADRTVRLVAAGDAWAFTPTELELAVGTRVGFRNESNVTHTATCSGCPWDTGDVQPGETAMLDFSEPLAFPFVCRYHGRLGMRGDLRVGGATPSPSPGPVAPGGGPVGSAPPTAPGP